jgi:hypothetical protein
MPVKGCPMTDLAPILVASDISLHVVARLLGSQIAQGTAGQMEYPWQPSV